MLHCLKRNKYKTLCVLSISTYIGWKYFIKNKIDKTNNNIQNNTKIIESTESLILFSEILPLLKHQTQLDSDNIYKIISKYFFNNYTYNSNVCCALRYIKNQTTEMCYDSVNICPSNIKYCNIQSESLCFMALISSVENLYSIKPKNITLNIIKLVIDRYLMK